MATNPDIAALLNAVAAVQQEVTDLEGKVDSGTSLSSGDFAAIRQATDELNALAGGTPAAPANSGGSASPNPVGGTDEPASSPSTSTGVEPGAAPPRSDTATPGAGV